jgi:apolipoprotein N-acyltransferase
VPRSRIAAAPPINSTTATEGRKKGYKNALIDFALVLGGALLYALPFPSPVSQWGWFPLAYIAVVPVFLVVRRTTWVGSVLWGFLYGFATYATVNYWLINFHPLSIFIVPVIYAVYFAFFFPLFKAATVLFPRHGYLVQVVVWMAYEYFRIQFFLGYAYGIIGYSQYLFRPLLGVAEFGGVWIVSALVVFPSAWLAWVIDSAGSWREALSRGRERMRPMAIYAVLFVLAIAYGFVSSVDLEESPQWRVALVQQNVDPWRGGLPTYRRALDILMRQSDLALKEDPDIVVWSETSFVPSINYHTRYRTNPESYALVRELTEYLREQDVPFVIGNGEGELRPRPDGSLERVDYNAVLLHDQGEYRGVYRKIHLVPFTEHFPFEAAFPWLHRLLVENDTTFWEAGEEYTVFEAAGVRFSTPICFEDTFGYLSRRFVREGAEVIVNLTNDSWSYSVPAAMQHMAMAVFRAVENRRSVVRSTNGGMTTVIDPNGRITAMLPAFTEGYLLEDVPVYTDRRTLYTAAGDWLAWVFVLAAAGLLAGGTAWRLLRLTRR